MGSPSLSHAHATLALTRSLSLTLWCRYVLVLASDGVWDVLSNQSALTVAAAAPPGVTPAQHLTDVASQSWKQLFPQSPMDDIGVAVGIIHTCK
jgi:serine/threonine protein phosphatase PrpC